MIELPGWELVREGDVLTWVKVQPVTVWSCRVVDGKVVVEDRRESGQPSPSSGSGATE